MLSRHVAVAASSEYPPLQEVQVWAPLVVQPSPVVAVPSAQVQVQAVVEAAILAELTQPVLRLLLATHAPQSVWEKELAF